MKLKKLNQDQEREIYDAVNNWMFDTVKSSDYVNAMLEPREAQKVLKAIDILDDLEASILEQYKGDYYANNR